LIVTFPSGRYPDPTTHVPISPVVLDRFRFMAMATLGEYTLRSMQLTIDAQADLLGHEGRMLVSRLTANVLGQDLGARTQTAATDVEWHVPASWVQHWKATTGSRWRVGRWWNRRRPPRMSTIVRTVRTEVRWEERAGFPYSNVVVDDSLGRAVLYVSPQGRARTEPSTPTYRT
jgi:hypothetical protein